MTSKEVDTSESHSLNTLRATQLLKIIPDFHGRNSENIHEFIDTVDEGFNLVKKEDEKILLAFLRTKLKGSAFKAVQYIDLESWPQLKEHLQRRFGVGDNIQYIEKEFTLLTQRSRETVAEFGERTCTLAAKISEYNIREKGYDAETFSKIMEDRIMYRIMIVLSYYVRHADGSTICNREPVRFQLKTYRCKDYHEAIGIACHLEKELIGQKDFDARNYLKKIGLNDQASNSERPKCFTCGKPGHKTKDCFHRKENNQKACVKVIQCFNCQKNGSHCQKL